MAFSLRRGKTHSSCTNRSPPLRIQSLSFLSTRSVPRRARLTSLTSCRYDTRISWMESERYRCGCFFLFSFFFILLFRRARTSAAQQRLWNLRKIVAQCDDLDIAASTETSHVSARIATKDEWNVFHVPRRRRFCSLSSVELERNPVLFLSLHRGSFLSDVDFDFRGV